MRSLKYVVYREGKYYVSQCLNADVSSFGKTIEEAVENLKDAVELYLRDEPKNISFHDVGDALIGETQVHA
ncbi:MAG: type II toxin-antitoxin system HicB family antitoxin [Desulfobacteraceae bacterium]|nr:type II toxin-antitoxin system HicB family antitoxin [Desulfobacteraceae bacterium]MBU4053095.1 type II toxin-antitoxin system HicB family antitoxin [Pseudomonadota bacterium]